MTRDIEELLPFYVNGTLNADERAAVEEALRADPRLRRECGYLEGLRREMQAMTRDAGPGELGLKRLQKALENEKPHNDPIARARAKIAAEQDRRWKALAVAACLLLAVQSALVLPPWLAGDLGAAGGRAESRAQAAFRVTFAPHAAEGDIRALLVALDVQVVSGPSALGVYRLSGGADAGDTLEKLRARPDLVESVEAESP